MRLQDTHGMPHHMAHYTGAGVNQCALDDGAWCACCGKRATEAHHEPPKGLGGGNSYRSLGGERIRPALIALCPECHAKRHSGMLRIEWEFDDQPSLDEWESGWPLAHGFIPHDTMLYECGRWEFYENGKLKRTVTAAHAAI